MRQLGDMQQELRIWIVIAIVLLNAYSLGAGCVERFVNYQSWPLLRRADFAAYHRVQQPFILGFIVVPLALSFLLQIAFCFFRPAQISEAIALSLVVPSAVGALSTALIQIPIHRRLNAEGYSLKLITDLLRSDWLRKACDLVRMTATIALIRQMLLS